MTTFDFFRRLRSDDEGTTIIEFAILAPVILGMFLGLMQIGISMQAYNSLRGVASDTARYAVVEYMNMRKVSDSDLQTQAIAIAQGSPYLLGDSVNVTVTPVVTPRVHGTHEKTITITYTPMQIMPFFDFTSGQMSFSRPIFVIDE